MRVNHVDAGQADARRKIISVCNDSRLRQPKLCELRPGRRRYGIDKAGSEVADTLASRRRLGELRAELVDSLRQAVELADLRYRGGVSSYLDYLDSERQLLEAQLRLVQIRREESTNTITLYRALGRGWQQGSAWQAIGGIGLQEVIDRRHDSISLLLLRPFG